MRPFVFRIKVAICFLLLLLTMACGRRKEGDRVRAVYYWNTTFRIDSLKRDFLDRHQIGKIYVRYFDVVPDESGGFPMPNATIRIDSVPADLNREIVPVVFILPDALDCDRRRLADMILRRVKQMSETHGMGTVTELQIDCDWTRSTRDDFFDLMQSLKDMTAKDGITLSSTIRLHQLAGSPPPADKGVLMVYNTGDMRDIGKEKPILDPDDVMPYLKYIKDYPLPLVSAYPIYRWDLLFRNGEFVDIMHSDDDLPVLQSDSIVVRQPSITDIIRCRREIESRRLECADEIILFDLNNFNIKRYDKQNFEDIFN